MKDLETTFTVLLLLGSPIFNWAQNVQTIRGAVLDRQSNLPLIGVALELLTTETTAGTSTDLDGNFTLTKVPLGRHTLRLTYLGYETVSIPNVIVDTDKETILNLSMVESLIEMNEVVITAGVDKDRTNNEMATISAGSFNPEGVAPYSGGRYFTPIDLAARWLAGTEVLPEDLAFSERFDPYLRLDVKFGFRLNSKNKKLSQQFFLDLQNITNNENIFTQRYNELTNQVNNVYQSGFFPDILYRVQF